MAVETERLPPIAVEKKVRIAVDDEFKPAEGIYAGKFMDRSPFLQPVSFACQFVLYVQVPISGYLRWCNQIFHFTFYFC